MNLYLFVTHDAYFIHHRSGQMHQHDKGMYPLCACKVKLIVMFRLHALFHYCNSCCYAQTNSFTNDCQSLYSQAFVLTFVTFSKSSSLNMQVYYQGAVGAFVVFDVTQSKTFDAVQMWKDDVDNKLLLPNGKHIPAVLLANKVAKR